MHSDAEPSWELKTVPYLLLLPSFCISNPVRCHPHKCSSGIPLISQAHPLIVISPWVSHCGQIENSTWKVSVPFRGMVSLMSFWKEAWLCPEERDAWWSPTLCWQCSAFKLQFHSTTIVLQSWVTSWHPGEPRQRENGVREKQRHLVSDSGPTISSSPKPGYKRAPLLNLSFIRNLSWNHIEEDPCQVLQWPRRWKACANVK